MFATTRRANLYFSLLIIVVVPAADAAWRPTWRTSTPAPRARAASTPTTAQRADPPRPAAAFPQSAPVLPKAPALRALQRVGLPVASYVGLGATTFGTVKLLTASGMGAVSATGLVALPVLAPALFLLYAAATDGGSGIAKRMGGKPASPRVVRLATDAANAIGVPLPSQVYTIPSHEPNAFAAGGLFGQDCVVAVTDGLLDRLTADETRAVLAHEMGHLRHRDVGRNVHVGAAAAGLGGIYEAGRWLLNSRSSSSRKKDEGDTASVGVTLMAIGLGTQAAAHLLRLSASRAAELDADAAAAEAFGTSAMISALQKISGARVDDKLRSGLVGNAMAHAMISDGAETAISKKPSFGDRVLGAMRTHPTLDERVGALRALEKGKPARRG